MFRVLQCGTFKSSFIKGCFSMMFIMEMMAKMERIQIHGDVLCTVIVLMVMSGLLAYYFIRSEGEVSPTSCWLNRQEVGLCLARSAGCHLCLTQASLRESVGNTPAKQSGIVPSPIYSKSTSICQCTYYREANPAHPLSHAEHRHRDNPTTYVFRKSRRTRTCRKNKKPSSIPSLPTIYQEPEF